MFKIEYRNPDGTGFNETDPWVSEPVLKEQLGTALEKMKANGCTVVNIVDMGESVYFTQEEIQMLYAACMGYREKLSQIVKSLPDEKTGILDGLSERAAEFGRLAGKITGYMGDACT